MKILEKRYPLGTLPKQKTDGRYISSTLNENLKILAKNITKDMTYLSIITSSTLEVGTGKSVLTQQIAEAYLEHVKQFHDIDNRLTMKNLVFRPKDIIERAFQVPKYSVVICDEWEDNHYFSELGKTLRQFFRKCRQLNLFIMIIIPNFFQLPMSYAVSRSVFLIDVKFTGEFNRGYFSFYNFQKKKKLYIHGKKNQDYDLLKPNFTGRFVDGYVVDEDEYRKSKLKDLEDQDGLEKKPEFNKKHIENEIVFKLEKGLNNITNLQLLEALGWSERTYYNRKKTYLNTLRGVPNTEAEKLQHIISYSTEGEEKDPQNQEEENKKEADLVPKL